MNECVNLPFVSSGDERSVHIERSCIPLGSLRSDYHCHLQACVQQPRLCVYIYVYTYIYIYIYMQQPIDPCINVSSIQWLLISSRNRCNLTVFRSPRDQYCIITQCMSLRLILGCPKIPFQLSRIFYLQSYKLQWHSHALNAVDNCL